MVAAVGLVVPATLLIFLPLSPLVGALAGLGMWAGALTVLWAFSPVIRVEGGTLRVGNARIDLAFVGDTRAFRGEDARHEKGPGAHGLAWMSLRPWIDPVVKISVTDSQKTRYRRERTPSGTSLASNRSCPEPRCRHASRLA